MIMDFFNKEISVNLKGEAASKMDKYGISIIAILVIILNLIPMVLLVIYMDRLLLLGVVIWYMWIFYSVYNLDGTRIVLELFTKLPLLLPSFILMMILSEIFKVMYLNSDEPDDIKRWNRKKKIKTIL